MAGITDVTTTGYEDLYTGLFLDEPEESKEAVHLTTKEDSGEIQNRSLMRQVAELAARVMATLQEFSQLNKESIERLKFTVRTNTEGASEQLEAKGDMTSGTGFLSFTVTVLSTALMGDQHQAIARAFSENLPKFVEVFGTKYDANSMTLQMKGRLAETELQNKANAQQSESGAKGAIEQLLTTVCQTQTSLARGG